MNPIQMLEAGAEMLEDFFPETVTINGSEPIKANVTDIMLGRGDRTEGGNYPILSGTVFIRNSQIPDGVEVKSGGKIEVRTQTLFIGEVRGDSVGVELELKPRNRRE